jgi:multiple sugar transport system substrate-binding protein
LAILTAVALVSAAAFAGGSGEAAGSPAEKVDLKIAWWGSQARHEGTIKVIELYMQKNPNVAITYEFTGWNDYWTKVTTMAAGGMMPDVMQQDYARIEEWASRGLHAPLDPFIKSGVLDISDTSESLLASGRINGQLYGINLGSNSQAFLLDVDAFNKAGIPLPAQDWTWEDFEKLARALHDELGTYGMGIGLDGDNMWKSLYISNGQGAYTKDGKALGYADDALFSAYLKRVLVLIKDGVVPSKAEAQSTFGEATTNVQQMPIVTGKAPMESIWSNQAVAVATAAGPGRNFTLIHLPRLKKSGPASNYLKPSMLFSVSSQGKNQAEAAKLISFFTNDIDANKLLMAERGVPIAAKVRAALSPMLPAVTQEVFAYVARVAKDGSPIPPPDPVGHTEIMNNVYKPTFDKVMYGALSVDEGVKILREQATAILKKN